MSEEIRPLIEKAKRYLHSAAVLRAEGDYDSAASRLYYAMFYCATALLATKGFSYKTQRGIISGFGQHLVKTGELPAAMHEWLREAFDKRQHGDYMPLSELEEQDVRDLQEKGEQFVQRTEAFLRERGLL